MEDYIKKYFIYNPNSGNIARFDRNNSNGSLDKDGYLIYKIKGKQYKAHRLAWFLHYGKWPVLNIDHINGNRIDNRIKNLRDVSQTENVKNTKYKPNKNTGVIGVWIDNTKGLRAKFATKINGKTKRFRNLIEAINAKYEVN